MRHLLATTAAVLAAGPAAAQSDGPISFEYWYGLGGYLGEVVQQTCDRFNESQDDYEIVCVGQDGYANAVQNTIAAFRADQHPTLVQAYDAGTADLMLSGEFYPVEQMMADFDIDIDWDAYFPAIANYYASSEGEMFSMPFNSSTPVMYYNEAELRDAGIETPPATWAEFEAALEALDANGEDCPYAYAPSSWVDLEQFSMAHNIPVASNNNGYGGLDSELVFNETRHAEHMKDIARWHEAGLLQIRTAQGGLNARDSFAQDECSFYFGSIAGHQTVHDTASADMAWDVAMLPVFADAERHNTVVGGASLWVLSGKSEAEYRGAAAYLKFLSTPASEAFWSRNTGYIPVTRPGYENLVEQDFYQDAPYAGRETAVESLTYTEPTELTRGIRLGGMIQIRDEWNNEVQAALAGEKSMQAALDTAVERGNAVLDRFARTYEGQELP